MITMNLLNPAQLQTVNYYKALNVPATWFVGEPSRCGVVEVIALGGDFIWALTIGADGIASTSEAYVGEFTTGIEV